MKKRFAAIAASLLVAGSVLLATAGIATAVTSPSGGPAGSGACATLAQAAKGPSATVASVQAFATCEIDRRLTTLAALSTRVSSARALLGTHASTLAAEIAGERSGLIGLRAHVAADTTLIAVRADLVRIVTEFRVYVLVVPQVNLTIAADAVVAAKAKFDQIGTALAARIATAAAAGRDTTAAQAALDAMNASVAAAVALAGPIPGQILPLTPAQFNAGTAGPVITAARTALAGARDDLKAAAASAKACLQALKQ
jgi:hypothetical protein